MMREQAMSVIVSPSHVLVMMPLTAVVAVCVCAPPLVRVVALHVALVCRVCRCAPLVL